MRGGSEMNSAKKWKCPAAIDDINDSYDTEYSVQLCFLTTK